MSDRASLMSFETEILRTFASALISSACSGVIRMVIDTVLLLSM